MAPSRPPPDHLSAELQRAIPPDEAPVLKRLRRRLRDEPRRPRLSWLMSLDGMARYPAVEIPVPDAPGRLLVSRMPGEHPDALPGELDALVNHGVSRVACLLPSDDLLGVRADYIPLARDRFADRWRQVEIRDYDVPTSDTPFEDEVVGLHEALRSGETALVHCAAGCGRTGTFVGCLLVRAGMKPAEAIRHFRRHRCCGPETEAQLAWVWRYAARNGG